MKLSLCFKQPSIRRDWIVYSSRINKIPCQSQCPSTRTHVLRITCRRAELTTESIRGNLKFNSSSTCGNASLKTCSCLRRGWMEVEPPPDLFMRLFPFSL